MPAISRPLLSGVRVLDLTHAWAGPFATQLLADYGAEVIKIEACARPDMLRFSMWPEDETRLDAYNRGGFFQYLGRNKFGLTLDLKHPKGQELFKRLAQLSDVVIENFSARVMPSLGLEFPVLHALNPRLIMVSMPGYGAVGPYRDFVAFGEMIEPFAGLSEITGYPDRSPLRIAVAYPDPVAGFHAVLAILLALRQRRQTCTGQHIQIPHREPITRMLGEAVLDYTVNGRTQGRMGNRHRAWAPHGCYPCRAQGSWITIAVRTDAEWTALCQVLGEPAWATDPRFANSLSRWKQSSVLDECLAQCTRQWEAYALATHLREAGVPAGVVQTNRELLSDEHLRARHAFWVISHHLAGTYPYPGPSTRLTAMPPQYTRPAPDLGEHNTEILEELLGLSPAAIQDLEAQGVIGTIAR
ncbi:MAG: CoA transferase [Nitrospinae bacterium]|nr:CoA transferase [Nitrospinota bacterium]